MGIAFGAAITTPTSQTTSSGNSAAARTPAATVTVTESPTGQAGDDKTPTSRPSPTRTKPAENSAPRATRPGPRQGHRTYLVTYVVDGDTIELGNGERVRLVGIDTPERGDCGYEAATANMERLVLDKRVTLTRADGDRDRYARLLRYVDIGRVDAGLRQVRAGPAIASYDSRDGYGYHPRENRYIATDKATPNKTCPTPAPAPCPRRRPIAGSACAPGYDPCVPPYPPDLDCADVNGPIRVTGNDPNGLDHDGDGIGCE